MSEFAVIFDMDGVIVDNRAYHFRAWEIFAEKYDLDFDARFFKDNLFGKTNPVILGGLFKEGLPADKIDALGDEKEALYRDLHKGHVHPVPGLKELVDSLRAEGISMAVATAAPRINMDFVLGETGLRDRFQVLVDAGDVRRGKPDPEIYLKAASLLGIPPRSSVACEDSYPGVASALAAGMKVIAVATTHTHEELRHAHRVVEDFRGLRVGDIRELVSPGGGA